MKVLEYAARGLALLWAGFWMLFFTAESVAWHTPLDRITIWLTLGLAFLLVALAPWRWEAPGGGLLIAAGVIAGGAYVARGPVGLPAAVRVATLLAFAVPPVVAGALFLLHHHRMRCAKP